MAPRPSQISRARSSSRQRALKKPERRTRLEELLIARMQAPLNSDRWYIGSELAKKIGPLSAFFTVTHCALYPARVLSEAMQQYASQFPENSQDSNVWLNHARKIARMGDIASFKDPETSIPAYLTRELGWKAYYWSRDVYHQEKHSWVGQGDRYWAYQYEYSVTKKNRRDSASGIPINGFFVNFSPRPVKYASGDVISRPMPDAKTLEAFKAIDFAYGFYRGGYHNWVLHRGMIYEAHWAGVSMGGIQGIGPLDAAHSSTSFEEYWKKAAGGVIITPSTAAATPPQNSPIDFYGLMKEKGVPSDRWDEVSKAI